MNSSGYVTTGKAAHMLGVGLNTIKRWIANGDLRGIQTPGGHWRIPGEALHSFMREHGFSAASHMSNATPRVLIVDDDPSVCVLLEAILEQADFSLEVKCIQDGYTGLIQIGAWRPDVLVLDIIMPGMNGLDVLQRLRDDHELLGNMAIVVVTSAFDQPDIVRAVHKARPDAALSKPVDTRQFLAAIGACLASPAAVPQGAGAPGAVHT